MILLPERVEDLIDFGRATLRVSSREGKHREFKRQFERADFSRYTKVLSAFCNTDGGLLIFGVAEKPRRIEGIDPATVSRRSGMDRPTQERLRSRNTHRGSRLSCRRSIPGRDRPWRGTRNGRSYANELSRRESSAREGQSDATVIQEGTIYYRQAGQTRPIAYAELQAILQERDERRLRAFLESVQIMQKVGPERVGIVDASSTGIPGESTKLFVSREVAKSLNFIDRGRFVEIDEEGSPAYVVAGTVQLNEVIERPLDDADRNLPNEAAGQIRPVVEELFGAGTPFTGHHLAKLAQHLGVRNGTETDRRYCVYDQKVKRAFYLRAGIEHIMERLRAEPDDCLPAFASRATIQAYEAGGG